MLVIYTLIATFIAWIWIDYFRLIDIFEKESIKLVVLTFILGGASTLIIYYLQNIVLIYAFKINGNIINDFLYCTVNIGVAEELAKSIPFIIIYFLFKSEINEPIDYLLIFSISALGFSAVENILYFQHYNAYIINNRAIWSTVAHMFDSSLVAYGIILYKFRNKNIIIVVLLFLLASLSHAFYDFWLIFEDTKEWGFLITSFYFLITVSLFAVILNNALNNSSFFTDEKYIRTSVILSHLFIYYGIVFLSQFVLIFLSDGFNPAVLNFKQHLFTSAFIIVIIVVRLSRFKLVKGRWEKLKFELPFKISTGESYYSAGPRISFSIKGESTEEIYLNKYYHKFFSLSPVSKRNTYLTKTRLAFIERKLFLKNYNTSYVVKIFDNNNKHNFEYMLIYAKLSGTTKIYDDYPIVAVFKIRYINELDDNQLTLKDFDFVEWAFIASKDQEFI